LEALRQPLQVLDAVGQDAIGQAVQRLGVELVDGVGESGQPGWDSGRMGVRVHEGNLSTPHQNTSTSTTLWMTFLPAIRGLNFRP
jgi:hypothetical protein